MKHAGWSALRLALVAVLCACAVPGDALFTPPTLAPPPLDERVQITFNPGPDVARGFRPDGRLVYWSRGLLPFGSRSVILSISVAGGAASEEASPYRESLLDDVRQLEYDSAGRTLITWKNAVETVHGCGAPAPPGPIAVAVGLYRLRPEDGGALHSTPQRFVDLPVITGAATSSQRVRITPAEQEARQRGVNPFGPAVGAGQTVVSDGETLWRVSLDSPSAPAESLGPGAFPARSADGRWLAAAVPLGLDSTAQTTVVTAGLGSCTQETVTITSVGWEILVYDLTSGTSSILGAGLEPRFDPDGTRLLVRREALYWVALTGGSTEVVLGTEGAYAPAISPDGSLIAFSMGDAPDHNVFLMAVR